MRRSNCPISNALDHIGDKWSLLILRDIALFNKRTYTELQESDEKIATNILADRLNKLEESKVITKSKHPKDKRKKLYKLTNMGLDLIPILLDMIIWSVKYNPELYAPEDFLLLEKTDRETLIEKIINKNLMETTN